MSSGRIGSRLFFTGSKLLQQYHQAIQSSSHLLMFSECVSVYFHYPLTEQGFESPPCYDWCAVGERLGWLVVVEKKMVVVV